MTPRGRSSALGVSVGAVAGLACLLSLAWLAYHQLGNWDAAVKTLEELAAMPSGANRPLVLLSLGSLASEDPDRPSSRSAKIRLEHLGMQLIAQRARAGDKNPGADRHTPR